MVPIDTNLCVFWFRAHRFRTLASAFTSQYPDLKIDIDAELARYKEFAAEIRPCIADTVMFLNRSIRQGKKILVEGVNATMLDIDFGMANGFCRVFW